MYSRLLTRTIEKWMFRQKVLVITGARQVGKTTLLLNFLSTGDKSVLFLNAEELSNRKLFEELSVVRLTEIIGNNDIVVIDEAQQIENIGLC